MATTNYLLGLIFGIGIIGYGLPHRGTLKGYELYVAGCRSGCSMGCGLRVTGYGSGCLKRNYAINAQTCNSQQATRNTLIAIARSQIGVRELTGNNDGERVEAYLKVTNLPKGNPWCAAFVSWVYFSAGCKQPRTAWSPALFPLVRQTRSPLPADVLGIYSLKFKRIAHCGLVERRQNNWIISIEGNTNADGSREGDGVYRKWRHIRTIAKFADWVR